MNVNFNSIKQQTQEFLLRLFIESSGGGSTPPHYRYYTNAHAGTHARLHQ